MKQCRFCGGDFPDARPFQHCMAEACVRLYLTERAADMTINLVPKVGYVPAYKSDMKGA